MNGVGGPIQVASELRARYQPDSFAEVPVLQLSPGLLAPADIDTRRGPRLAERLEMPQHGVERRVSVVHHGH